MALIDSNGLSLIPQSSADATGTSYTLAAADANRIIYCTNGGATVDITIPLNADVPYPLNTRIDIVQLGAAVISIVNGGGITVISADGNLSLRAQYSSCSLIKRDLNTWLLIGDLA